MRQTDTKRHKGRARDTKRHKDRGGFTGGLLFFWTQGVHARTTTCRPSHGPSGMSRRGGAGNPRRPTPSDSPASPDVRRRGGSRPQGHHRKAEAFDDEDSPPLEVGHAPSFAGSPESRKVPRSEVAATGPTHKAWWEYEEQLARLAFDLRGEAQSMRAAHTKDIGILLQQQLALRSRVDELHAAFEQGEFEAADPLGLGSRGKLAATVAATSSDAAELQLTLLERGQSTLGYSPLVQRSAEC